MPTLLSKKNYVLIIHIAKLIINYNFIPNTITYRALIATLIHIDMALTKRLYQTAIGLGIYSRIQVPINTGIFILKKIKLYNSLFIIFVSIHIFIIL